MVFLVLKNGVQLGRDELKSRQDIVELFIAKLFASLCKKSKVKVMKVTSLVIILNPLAYSVTVWEQVAWAAALVPVPPVLYRLKHKVKILTTK